MTDRYPPHVIADLGRKVIVDVLNAIKMTADLCPDPLDKLEIYKPCLYAVLFLFQDTIQQNGADKNETTRLIEMLLKNVFTAHRMAIDALEKEELDKIQATSSGSGG